MKITQAVEYETLAGYVQQKYNFIKLSAALVDQGLLPEQIEDSEGIAFTLKRMGMDNSQSWRVQLRSRPTVSQQYHGKNWFIAFPLNSTQPIKQWVIVSHDDFEQVLLSHSIRLYANGYTRWNNAKVKPVIESWLEGHSIVGTLVIESLNR